MSIRVMSEFFGLQLGSANRKMVALRLADFADDSGRGIWPTVERVANECELSVSTVQRVLREFVAEGMLIVVKPGGGGRGSSTRYDFDLDRVRARAAEIAGAAPAGDKGVSVTPLDESDEKGVSQGAKGVSDDGLGCHRDTRTVIEPSDPPVERERGREEENPTEDRRAVEKAFERAWQAWPTSVSDSRPEALKVWMGLSPEERDAAAREAERWVAAAKAAGRKHVCSHANYLRDKRWRNLPEQEQEAPRQAEAKPFGKAFMALRFRQLLAGREAGAMIPALTGFEMRMVADGTADEAELARRKVAAHGFPKVNRLHEIAANGRSITVPVEVEALGQSFEAVRVGGERWQAWREEHERRGWPWLPDTGRQEWVYFPAGGPEGLAAFEAALRAQGQEAVSAANRDAGSNRHEHGGGREAAE